MAAKSLRVLAAFDAHGDGEVLHGARSTVSWLTGALGIAPGDASSRVHLARASRSRLAPVVSLLADGQVTYDHVRGIGSAVRDLADEHVAPAVDVLADLATRVDVKQLQQAGKHLQDVVNPDGALAANQHDFSRRRLHLSPLLDGMVAVDGLLDPESAATLDAALAPFLVPAGSSDDRTTPQRRADGLVELAKVAMSQTDLGISGGTRPQLSVLCTLPALTHLRDGRPSPPDEVSAPGWGRLERPGRWFGHWFRGDPTDRLRRHYQSGVDRL